MERKRIKIRIADRFYPLTVEPNEEEILRKAGKEINEKVQLFEKKYAVQDKQDALAMAALQVCASYLGKKQDDGSADQALENRLKYLLRELQDATK